MGTRSLFECGSNEKGQDQKKVFSTNSYTNSDSRLKILAIFREFLGKDQKKKDFRSKSFMKSGESTKTAKKQFLLANSRAVNINLGVLGLDLHSSSPEPINFFGHSPRLGGAQFLFGGHKQSFGGARPRNAPRGAGPAYVIHQMLL